MNLVNLLSHISYLEKKIIEDKKVTGFSFDTRTFKSGEIFLALKAEGGRDGHTFIDEALKKGASACLIDQKSYMQDGCVCVKSVLESLCEIAKFYRQATKAKVIAITGSCGKTTTKEMLRHVLHNQGRTVFSQKSYNNHIGVPFSLTSLKEDVDFGVFEIGMNHPGEINPLAKLVEPDIAIITGISESHIGQMKSLQAICDEKAEIFSHMHEKGCVIFNRDNAFFDDLVEKAKRKNIQKIVSVGYHRQADVRLESYEIKKSQSLITAEVFGKMHAYPIHCVGEHMAINSLFVVAACYLLGVDMGKVFTSLSKMQAVEGRSRIEDIFIQGKKITLIDDAYNASPSSMKAGLKLLTEINSKRSAKRYAVIGAMLELGELSIQLHQEVGLLINKLSIDGVICVGDETEPLYQALRSEKKLGYFATDEHSSVQELVKKTLNEDDVLLVKGSNGTKLWKLANLLKQNR